LPNFTAGTEASPTTPYSSAAREILTQSPWDGVRMERTVAWNGAHFSGGGAAEPALPGPRYGMALRGLDFFAVS